MKILKSPDGNLVELTMFFHYQTEKALLVSDNNRNEDAIWIPISQCEDYDILTGGDHSEILIIIPEWLAIEKELV